jgi:hypothetical protein
MAQEKRAVDIFIQQKLTADTQLMALAGNHVYNADAVPQGADPPFVSYGSLSFLDRNALPATVTVFSMPVYFVRATIQGRDLTVGYQLQDRIDQALRGQSGNVVIGSETYYIGPWFRRALRQLPPENEGTLLLTQIGIEVESRVQKLS